MEMKNDVTGKFYITGDNALTKELVYWHLTGIENIFGGKHFLVSDNVTYVDFIFFEVLNLGGFLKYSKLFEEHRTIKAYVKRMKDLHNVRASSKAMQPNLSSSIKRLKRRTIGISLIYFQEFL